MKNLIPRGDKKFETNSSRTKEINRRIKSREKKIVFDFSIANIIHFSLFIAIGRFEPPSALSIPLELRLLFSSETNTKI